MFNNNKIINKIANNKYLSYLLTSFAVLAIIIYPYIDDETKITIRKYIRNPNILLVIMLANTVLSFYNFPLFILLSVLIYLILSGGTVQLIDGSIKEGFANNKKGERTHFFMKHFGIDTKDMANELQRGLEENRKLKIRDGIKSTMKNNKKNKDGIAIKQRIFDLQDEDDTNLLNTREICKDIINRINYQYEDVGYLKKYISSRIEEIVDLNNLLESDE